MCAHGQCATGYPHHRQQELRLLVAARLAAVQAGRARLRRAGGRPATTLRRAPNCLLLSPSFLVPCLTHDGIKIWDTLAIAEYLNEILPDAGLLPKSRGGARALPLDLRRDAFRLFQSALGAADEPEGASSGLQGLGRRAGRHRPHHQHLARVPRRPARARFCSATGRAWPTPCTRRCDALPHL